MLTVADLVVPAAAPATIERRAAMLASLQAAGLLPADPDAPLDTMHVVALACALLSAAEPSAAGAEALRVVQFHRAGTSETRSTVDRVATRWEAAPAAETLADHLTAMIDAGRAGKQPSGISAPFQLRRVLAANSDTVSVEWIGREGGERVISGVVFGVADTRTHVGGAVSKRTEICLAWLLVDALAESLGPRAQSAGADLSPAVAIRVAGKC
jgi:hypothetical protein